MPRNLGIKVSENIRLRRNKENKSKRENSVSFVYFGIVILKIKSLLKDNQTKILNDFNL